MSKSLIVPKYPPQGRRHFDPFAVGQPAFLFDAAKGITLNGADVSAWADQSGNGNDLSQGTAVDQPVWSSSHASFNGQPALVFNGLEFIAGGALSTALSQPFSLVIVCRVRTLGRNERILDYNLVGDRSLFWHRQASANFRMDAPTSRDIFSEDTDAHTDLLVFNAASSLAFRDGTADHPATSPGANGLGSIRLGIDSGGTLPLLGEIAYILGYDFEIPAAARQYIGKHLAARFGTTDGW